MRSSYDSKRFKHIFGTELLGCAHINQKDFTLTVYDWVLRLNVSIDNVINVQVLYGKEYTAKIISRDRFV